MGISFAELVTGAVLNNTATDIIPDAVASNPAPPASPSLSASLPVAATPVAGQPLSYLNVVQRADNIVMKGNARKLARQHNLTDVPGTDHPAFAELCAQFPGVKKSRIKLARSMGLTDQDGTDAFLVEMGEYLIWAIDQEAKERQKLARQLARTNSALAARVNVTATQPAPVSYPAPRVNPAPAESPLSIWERANLGALLLVSNQLPSNTGSLVRTAVPVPGHTDPDGNPIPHGWGQLDMPAAGNMDGTPAEIW